MPIVFYDTVALQHQVRLDFVKYMQIRNFIRARASRGLSIGSIGPNEARFLFDGATGIAASLLAVLSCRFLFSAAVFPRELVLAVSLPVLLMLSTTLLGMYSRLRAARARVKTVVLSVAVLLSSTVAWFLFANHAAIVLWAMLVTGPLVLARLMLSLHAGRHRMLAQIAINRRGPVLVLGGAGYIGSHTVDVLLRGGHDVRVLDRLMYGDQSLAEFRRNPRFSLIEGDATDIARLTFAVKDCSAVVHLAGLVGDPACAVNPQFTSHTNIIATRMVREVAEAMGVYRFIFASSCSVYGASDKEVSEVDALNPVSLYAQTKIDSERELLGSARDDFFVTILRFATVFGHSRRPRFDLVANLFTAQAMSDGLITVVGPDQWRPFIHVRDLARAIAATLTATPEIVQSQIFNVGDKRLNLTILQLAQKVQAVVSKRHPVDISVTENPQDRRNYAVSFEKIRTILDFQAATLMEDGIEEMATHIAAGTYKNYRSSEYSNVEMTARALSDFQNPEQMARLYAPLRVS